MRKIHKVFLTVLLFAVNLQTISASGDKRVLSGKKEHTSPLACPSSGTYTIGPGGDYASITLALADLYTCIGITGPFIFELKSNYLSSVEAFPITINAVSGSSAVNSITFRPELGATGLSITTNNATGTILFDGGQNFIFDGRPGGVGTTKELTIQNTGVGNSYAIRFVNDASDNSISFCNIKSANNNAAGATIIIAGTNGPGGNDNITIDNNDISEASTGTPANAIISSGSTTTAATYNSGIVISNNNIFNFFSSTISMAGINVVQGSSGWTISGNSFYKTIVATAIAGIYSAISAYNSQMSDFTITGNYAGGVLPQALGTPLVLTGSGIIQLFRFSLSTAVVNNIQGNTLRQVNFISNASSLFHSIINLADGAYNVGTVTGNTIGSSSFTGNVAISLSGNTANNFAIINCGAGSSGMAGVNISNNLLGNLDVAGTSNTANAQMINFAGSTGTYTINNNVLGSTTYIPSVNNYLNTILTAINGNLSANTHTITNNSLLNLYQPNAGTNTLIYGIRVQGNAVYNIANNIINGLNSSSTKLAGYSIVGISNTAIAPNQVISGNKLFNFITTSNVATRVAGIYYAGAASGTNIVERNFVHTFTSNSTITSALIVGIHAGGGSANYLNNMIRFGINSAGGNVITAFDFEGILEEAGTNDFYFNSVYIGGTGVGAGNASYAFNSAINTATTRNYKNNIFWNDRSNLSLTSPSHYAIKVAVASGISSDYNVLYASGLGRVLANLAGSDMATLALWRTNTGGDANSYSVNPQFINPTGNSTTVDLHIKPNPTPSVVEGNGLVIASVTDDYDAQSRPILSPADIGADAGNFTAVAKADMGPINLLNPTYFSCLNAVTSVKVVIKNFNSTAINFAASPVTVAVAVTGAIVTSMNTTINTGTLAAGDTLIVTLPATINMSAAGTYNFSITTSVGGSLLDVDVTNNAYTVSITPGLYNIGTLSSSVVNFCNSGIPVLTLTGTFGTVQWQESASSGGPWTNVGFNSLTYSPAIVSATTYYQAIVSCGASNGASNEVTVLVIPASISNTAALADGVAALTVCEGSSITLTQTGGSIVPGAQWQWYEGTAVNNFITPAGSSTTAADAATVIVPAANTTYYLRASGGTSPCDGNVPAAATGNPSATVVVKSTGTWLGVNTDWNDASNWCSGVPTVSSDAIIPTGLINYPVINAINSVRNITIQSGASVTLAAAGELTIKGNYDNTSGIISNGGKIILNGTATQNLPGSTATITAMKNVEVDNAAGVSIDKAFTITGTLQPTNGAITLNNNSITLYSDAVATANVGSLGSGAAFTYNGTGRFVVQRFIPAKRAWRLLTAPVTAASSPSINTSWQEGATKWPMGPATAFSNPADGFGAHISGGTNANGYDQNVNGNPSIKIFNAGLWQGLSVATSLYTKKVTDEPGYMLFVRGSRAVDLTFGTATVPNNTTLRISGQLNVANTTPLGITSTGLTCVGNPFASAINFNAFATENGLTQAENKFYLWDPTLTGSNGVGAWVTLAYNGTTYDRTVSAPDDYTLSGGSQGIDDIGTIQSGAAFMMDFGGSTRTLNFNETIKRNSSTSLVFRPIHKQMRTNLYWVNSSSNALLDGVLTTFDAGYSNAADPLDVNKLPNFSENFGLSREGKIFAIERRKPITVPDTIFFNMAQVKQRNYQFEFVPDSMAYNNLACYLEDNFLNSSTPVNLLERSFLPFSVTNNASAAKDRFRLVFKQWLQFNYCTATVLNTDITVSWKVMQEQDVNQYQIERSSDGEHFTAVGSRLVNNSSNGEMAYDFTDMNPYAGDYYYRIKAVSNHGVTTYSNTATVRILRNSPSMYVFPNPVVNNQVNLQISSSLPGGYYTARLLNAEGKTIASKKINHTGGSAFYTILPDHSLIAGTYQLEVSLPNKSRQVIGVMVK
ncbi:MAG: hypothetical protein IPP72_18525 [Chitinophagaceae bacterium]|nr:hypothetical protein [Chitinophagaceae bacterium]